MAELQDGAFPTSLHSVIVNVLSEWIDAESIEHRRLANDILGAIYAPTEGMLKSAVEMVGDRSAALDYWTSMIDAALAEDAKLN